MNQVCLTGRVTKDIVIEKVGKDQTVKAAFNIAVSRDRKNAEGGYDADFPRCIAWKSTAEFLQKYAPKGTMIELVGKIQTSSYQKDGQNFYSTDVIVEKAKLIPTGAKQHPESAENAVAEEEAIDLSDVDIRNEDLPF